MNRDKIVFCGAGGFIGGHLVADPGLLIGDRAPFNVKIFGCSR